jgi:RHS repeat-associated protein
LASATGEKALNFGYDNDGNTTAENSKQFIYNQNQRLKQVTDTGNVLGEYVYNGSGQRIKKYTENGIKCTVYHYDKNGMLIAESSSSGTIKAEYIYLNGQPLAKIDYHNDHLATSMVMTDSSGATVWGGEYLPFGEPLTVTGSVINNLRFPGQYYDSETELHYNYYRDYNPVVGRYVEADPILQPMVNLNAKNCDKTGIIWYVPSLISNPQELHAYSYSESNSVKNIDQFGLSSEQEQINPNPIDTRNCDGYKQYFGSSCLDDKGKKKTDSYHKNAHQCCKDFINKYNSSNSVNCVGECLTARETGCQKKKCCSNRASCRRSAHVYCYAKCFFVLYKSIPESCWKIVKGH